MNRVKVFLFANLKDRNAGRNFIEVDLPAGTTVRALKDLVARQVPGLSEAMPTVGDMAKSHSVVEKAACGGWGRHCRPGRHWVCGRRHCWCALC